MVAFLYHRLMHFGHFSWLHGPRHFDGDNKRPQLMPWSALKMFLLSLASSCLFSTRYCEGSAGFVFFYLYLQQPCMFVLLGSC